MQANKILYYFHVFGTDYDDKLPKLDVFTSSFKFNKFILIDSFETDLYLDESTKRNTHAFIASIVR